MYEEAIILEFQIDKDRIRFFLGEIESYIQFFQKFCIINIIKVKRTANI